MSTFARRMALAVSLCVGAGAAHAQVVISQVWGSAGSPGAAYNRDYVELFNRGTSAASLAGMSLQYQGANSNGKYSVIGVMPNYTLQPGQRYLIGLASLTGTTPLPTPDISGTTDIGTSGKLILVTGTTRMSCAHAGAPKCTLADPGRVVDKVGYGASANDYEGTAAAVSPTPASAIIRLGNGGVDTNNNIADFARAPANPRNSGDTWTPGDGSPLATISDTSANEGNSGATPYFFTISLNAPAGAGGVSINYATADGSASSGSDYVSTGGTATIAAGGTSVTISVDVNGDLDLEANETFSVALSNASGAVIYDAQGVGTITNDDVAVTAIHAIQGTGTMSPLAGQYVATRGIVTGRMANGFFIQDAAVDADPATSEALFVLTGSTPPAAAAVGSYLQAAGIVAEYVPATDALQAPLTQLVASSVVAISTGNALPSATSLNSLLPNRLGTLDQLESLEGMRVTADSFTVVAPTGGSVDEDSATSASDGAFHVVVTGVARPFREPGIRVPDPDPVGSTASSLQRWDFNPELIAVDSDAIGGATLDVGAGAILTGLVGPLDFEARRYTILAEADATIDVAASPTLSGVRASLVDEFTMASYNLQRFFDDADDGARVEPVLSTLAFQTRLGKASLAIRDYLNAPDIVGVSGVENLVTLQALADRISADALAASQPDPQYAAYLEEGNDAVGLDVGFLVKTAEVSAGEPRVEVVSVSQLDKTATWIDPSDGSTQLLYERPPLLLQAVIHYADSRQAPVTAIAVHQHDADGIASEAASGITSVGDLVRQQRQQEANALAAQVQARQLANADERIVVLGDFNAFAFNDGYADTMNALAGTPSSDDTTAVAGDGADLVEPDLVNLASAEAASQRYSAIVEGNAQSTDHVLVNQAVVTSLGFALGHARINADFPETARNDAGTPSRLSAHDPLVAYFTLANADISVEASATAPTALPGTPLGFDALVTNDGPDAAAFPGVGFAFDAELPDLVVTAPAGWACDVPTVDAGTTVVSCSAATVVNTGSAAFHLAASAPAIGGIVVSMVAAVDAMPIDPQSANNSDSASIDVTEVADLGVDLAAGTPGMASTSYSIVVSNAGSNTAAGIIVAIQSTVPASAAQVVAPAGWNCTPTGAATLDVECLPTAGSMSSGAAVSFGFNVLARYNKSQYRLYAATQSDTTDVDPSNNTLAYRLSMPRL